MKLNKLLMMLPIALLSLSACNGSSSGSNGDNGSGSDKNPMVRALPLGECDDQGASSGSAPGLTAGTKSEVFYYVHGYVPEMNNQIAIEFSYQALDDNGQLIVQLNTAGGSDDPNDFLNIPQGYCSILLAVEGNPTDLNNDFVGLSNCSHTMNGDVMSFTAKYNVFNSADSFQNNKPIRQGDFNFSCKLIHRDGHLPEDKVALINKASRVN